MANTLDTPGPHAVVSADSGEVVVLSLVVDDVWNLRRHLLSRCVETRIVAESDDAITSLILGTAAVQANAGDPPRYDMRTNKRKTAANHRIIGTSESYIKTAAMEKGIKSVMKNGATTRISDSAG